MLGFTPVSPPIRTSQPTFALNKPSTPLCPAVLATKDSLRHRYGSGNKSNPRFTARMVAASSSLTTYKLKTPSLTPSSSHHLFPFQESRRRKPLKPPCAYNEFYKFKYPVLTVKPEWWWRTLACIPYLIGLQISYTGYLFQPFVQRYDFFGDIIFFVPGAITRLPIWFVMVYSYCVYIGVVKNKHWPQYFRFHVVMGMLLELLLQIIWTASNFFPLIHYDGVLGMYYWAIIGVAYIVVTLICVVSALLGNYANIPIISDAAYIHTLFHIGGFQRPF